MALKNFYQSPEMQEAFDRRNMITPVEDKNWLLKIRIAEMPDKKLQTLIAATRMLSAGEAGLIIADMIRHMAIGMSISEKDIFDWVTKEINNPTTRITGSVVKGQAN